MLRAALTSLLAIGVLVVGSCGPRGGDSDAPGGLPVATVGATYVGRESCAGCHPDEDGRWRGSHHDRAMQEATEETVAGDFDGATFEHAGVTSTFSRHDGRFVVRTDGPDGALHDYDVAYTFGATPLQQYLIAMPGGRYQALGIAWDSRPREEGGQRWFHLYPDRGLEPGDPLHWTGIDQTWNHMCAECHSTNLRKGFVAAENRYATTWSELDVACEACHGPGSAHVAWARAVESGAEARGEGESPRPASHEEMGLVVRLRDRALDGWVIDPATGIARRTAPPPTRAEVETCASCHARRGQLDERHVPGRPLLDTHRPALLDRGLYHADGQIDGEVYEYGSFLQSRMYAAGVTCTECHDPHSLELLAGGDALCARCHAPERFAAASHHHHPADSSGARCVACHMPERTYMLVDARRDHSLRVPRPDLASSTGAPDACTGCHADRDARWAARAIETWHGPAQPPAHWGEAVAAAWRREPGADARLIAVAVDSEQPAIARGTALSLLRDPLAPASRAALARASRDPDGLVRLGALAALEGLAFGDDAFGGGGAMARAEPLDEPIALAAPLLDDPLLAVRTEAARLLAAVPSERLGAGGAAARDRALAEYRAAQEKDADRPEAHLNLGNLALVQDDPAGAERDFRRAIAIDPTFTPADVNLADVLRATGRDHEAESVLRAALARIAGERGGGSGHDGAAGASRSGVDDGRRARAGASRPRSNDSGSGELHHALGLTLVRLGRHREALTELERAAAAAPDVARYAYVLGIALHSLGRPDEGVARLQRAHRLDPGDAEILLALASIERDRGSLDAALGHARRLLELHPRHAGALALVAELEQTVRGSTG